jgi:hypothetical protein
MATIAMRIAVTTCPRPRSLSTPYTDIGATGWITITPYKIRSHSVSVRRNLGAADVTVVTSVPKKLSFRPQFVAIESFQAPSFCVNRLTQASSIFALDSAA